MNSYSLLILTALCLNSRKYSEKKIKILNYVSYLLLGLILLTIFMHLYFVPNVEVPDIFLIILSIVGIIICLSSILTILIYMHVRNKIVALDYLTGAYNRRFLDNYLRRKISSCRRKNKTFACILIDLDKFKKTNDTYGHDTGDDILKITVRLIEKCLINKKDFISRYGGDEFYIVLHTDNINKLKNMIFKISKSFDEYNFSTIDSHKISFSIGYSMYNKEHEDYKSFQRYIDRLMYYNKKNKYQQMQNNS